MKKKVRVCNLTIRISDKDHEMLIARAEEAGMTQSEYVRFLIRHTKIRVEVET